MEADRSVRDVFFIEFQDTEKSVRFFHFKSLRLRLIKQPSSHSHCNLLLRCVLAFLQDGFSVDWSSVGPSITREIA